MGERPKTKQHLMPVVLQNLPPAETLNQVIDNLNYLSNVMNEAFNTISTQIKEEHLKINNISQRITKASTQTDLISKYPNKATTVFSSWKFPENNTNNNDKPIIEMTDEITKIKRPKYRLSLEQRNERAPITDTLGLKRRLSERIKYTSIEKVKGLGKLPSWLESTSDCLLFNTDENLYVKYESTDNLQAKINEEKKIDTNKPDDPLTAAPQTILDKTRIMDTDTYDIAYKPELMDVPRFNVSNTLSGLGNLALDIGWQGTKHSKQKIAPSGVKFENLPSTHLLPDMIEGFDEFDDFDENDIVPPPPDAIAPPPVPNNMQAIQAPPIQQQQQQGSNVAPIAAPVPASIPTQQNNSIPSAPTVLPPPPKIEIDNSGGDDGGRGGLLAAIRAGKKLKSAKKNNNTNKKGKKAKPKAPLTLMDHLRLKLQARNNVMRGIDAQDDKNVSNDAQGIEDSDDEKASQVDNTGLGLNKLPSHLIDHVNDHSDDSSAGSWKDDD